MKVRSKQPPKQPLTFALQPFQIEQKLAVGVAESFFGTSIPQSAVWDFLHKCCKGGESVSTWPRFSSLAKCAIASECCA